MQKKAKQTEHVLLQRHQKIAIKGTYEERIQYLKSIIRENFAGGKSVMLVAPRIDILDKLAGDLSRGIENYIFTFSSKLNSKKYLSLFNKAMSENHPILLMGTYQILFFERPDLDTIIIEEEGSRFWREHFGLPIDARKIAEIIAEIRNMKLIWSDLILRAETIYKSEHGQLEARNLLTGRIQSQAEVRIIEAAKSESFSWITNALSQEIEESLFRGESVLLFANRRGYSSFTICQDCLKAQLCSNCSTPMVLHLNDNPHQKERVFICHHCLRITKVPTQCLYCRSWRIKDLGLGIEKVQEEFNKLFPKAENVTISTEKILSQTDKKFDLVAVISLDYLLSIPDFRINETIFRLIGELKSKAKKKFIIQTKIPENKLFNSAASGNLSSFYQEELRSRAEFGYPPFRKLIKLWREDENLSSLQSEEKKAVSMLGEYDPLSFPAFHEKLRKKYRRNILLRIDPNKWPDELLLKKLHSIKNNWQISVDPDSVL